MKKSLTACLALTLAFGAVGIEAFNSSSVTEAASAKVSLSINGASYYGEAKNGKPHGKGTMKWTNRSYDPNDNTYDPNKWMTKTYSGDWVSGKRSGQGKYIIQKSSNTTESYEGAWKNDKQNGSGTVIYADLNYAENDVKIGQFENNVFKSGYTGYTDVTGYLMEYTDANTYIRFMLPEGTERTFLNSNFKTSMGDIHTFQYQKKQSNGVIKGFSYDVFRMAAWEAYAYEGSYKKVSETSGDSSNYLNGTLKQENYDSSATDSEKGLVETYKLVNGKQTLVQRKSVNMGDPIGVQAKIDSRLTMLKPYLGGFKKAFNLMTPLKK